MAARAQQPATEEELSRHLTTVRAQIEHGAIEISRREDMALDMVATATDRVKCSRRPIPWRRAGARWSQAVLSFDWFEEHERGCTLAGGKFGFKRLSFAKDRAELVMDRCG